MRINFFRTEPKQPYDGYLFLVTRHIPRKSITLKLSIKLLIFSHTFTAIFVCPPKQDGARNCEKVYLLSKLFLDFIGVDVIEF